MVKADYPGGVGVDAVSGIFLLARELRREIVEVMATEQWAIDAGFRPPCLGVLTVVGDLGPVSQRAISDTLGLDASDVVGVLDILEAAGMVERRRDPDDRRRHAVVLTDHGERAAARLNALRSQVETKVLAGLDPDERHQLTKLLNRVAAGVPARRSTSGVASPG